MLAINTLGENQQIVDIFSFLNTIRPYVPAHTQQFLVAAHIEPDLQRLLKDKCSNTSPSASPFMFLVFSKHTENNCYTYMYKLIMYFIQRTHSDTHKRAYMHKP